MKTGIKKKLFLIEKNFLTGKPLEVTDRGVKSLAGDLSIAGDREKPGGRPAAVLIPLVRKKPDLHIFFTRRPDGMKEHAGQISFPGGRQERTDKTLVETALREAWEEVGLDPGLVSILGRLPPYRTITRYRVTPVVGLIEKPFTPRPDPREVREVFSAPLEFFLDQDNLKQRTRVYQGRERPYYYFDYEGFHIWGATAAMLINFRETLLAYAEDKT